MSYRRADFSILRNTGYGVGFHWTTWTWPRKGKPVSFPEAVEAFEVPRLVEYARQAGAGHVIFPVTHEMQWWPCPNPEVDRILPGRTCRRDLILEIADGLLAAGIRLVIYYNPTTHRDARVIQDPEWQEATGAGLPDRSRFFGNYCRILSWAGRHYGPKAIAFWIDGGRFLKGPDAPWQRMAEAAKDGFSGRLICYNNGIEETGYEPVTECQDFYAGESTSLDFRPSGTATPAGFPWYAFHSWHPAKDRQGRIKKGTRAARWGMEEHAIHAEWPPPPVEKIRSYLDAFRACGGTVAFNLMIYQDGTVLESDLDVMRRLAAAQHGS